MQELFLGGIPTEPDVQKLIDAFKDPSEGQIITWQEIANVIEEPYGSSRFRTVVTAWRKRLFRTRNIHLLIKRGQGLYAGSPPERIRDSGKRFVKGYRTIHRASVVSAATDRSRLTENEKKEQDFHTKHDAMMRLAYNKEVKRLRSGQ